MAFIEAELWKEGFERKVLRMDTYPKEEGRVLIELDLLGGSYKVL